jgi:opacity protein-like surface antigen
MRTGVLATCLGILVAAALQAQELPPLTYSIGVGFTEPIGDAGRALDTRWSMQAGAGYNFLPYFGTMLDFNFNSFGINGATLSDLSVPDGSVHVWSFTLDPVVHFQPKGRVSPYIIGGGGIFHRVDEFAQPSGGFVSAPTPVAYFSDSMMGDRVLGYHSLNKPGIDIGAGVDFETKWRLKIYAEARYNRMFISGGEETDFIPVMFGARW